MEITQELLHELFEYKDGELYWKKDKGKVKKGNKAGSIFGNGYKYTGINGISLKNSRLIFLMHRGYLPKIVDHINNNPLDDRIENLRPSDKSTNSMNSKLRADSTSGFKNVGWNKQHKKWRVRITIDGKSKYCGFYDILEDAVKAAEEARNKYHGEFANHGNKNEAGTRHRDKQHS